MSWVGEGEKPLSAILIPLSGDLNLLSEGLPVIVVVAKGEK
ncbi:hypothetical protein LD85_0937 [Saccharolobus islandicus L.D.8.5]|jgi:hypothetical protein|nr:hypothetical protein LD85_0937 [Sulfolobus islandicus L.D.8.5]